MKVQKRNSKEKNIKKERNPCQRKSKIELELVVKKNLDDNSTV